MELEFETNLTDEELKHTLGIKEAEEIHKRFENGNETLEDLMKNYISYHMKFEFRNKKIDTDMIELKYYKKLINYIYQLQSKIEDLEQKNKTRIIGKYGDVRLDDLLKDNYIPKSKVREILIKLDEEGYWEFLCDRDLVICCEILRELLEESKSE